MFGGRGFEKAHFRIRQWLQGNKGSPRQSPQLPSKRSRPFFFFFFSFAFFYSSERLSPCIRLGVGDFDNANAGDCLLGDDLCNTGDSLIMM